MVEVVEALRGGPGTGWQQERPREEEEKMKNSKIAEVKIS
jgi:hypothetical protein